MLGWRGRIESLNVQFGVCDDLTGVTLAARADFKRAVGDINAVKRVAAERMLETAKDWAEQGEMKINVGEAMLASSLRLESIDVGASRVTLYFDETAGVFAGHGVEVRIEGGEVSEVGLCG